MKKIEFLIFIALALLCVNPIMAADTGSINVISNPSEAQIWIDGNLQDAVVTPHTFDGLNIGTHSVEVHLDSYIDAKNSNVVIKSGETTPVDFQLKPMPAAHMGIAASTKNTIDPSGGFQYGINFWPETKSVGYKPFLWNLLVTWDPIYIIFNKLWSSCASTEIGPSSFSCEDIGTGYISYLTGYFSDLPLHKSTYIHFVGTLLDSHQQEIAVIDESRTIEHVPEYPSPYIPAIAIIGFLGAVLLIQRTRKQ